MSSVHCVVVWEWRWAGAGAARWVPHAAAVSRTLERAHHKHLTRVVLADADPALSGHYVNLRTLTQHSDEPGSPECVVRRSLYSVSSPAGRGVRWEWAAVSHSTRDQDLHYEALPMDMQCVLEDGLSAGAPTVEVGGWVVCLQTLVARAGGGGGGGGARLVRRRVQPPYPLTLTPPAHGHGHGHGHAGHQPPPTPPARTPVEGRRPRIPQQHTGSSVHSMQSTKSAQSVQSGRSVQSAYAALGGTARSVSPRDRDRKAGLARQILHNLNIFSNNNNKQNSPPDSKKLAGREKERERERAARESERDRETGTDTECGSTRSGRRHSVDTVSTYLSHESKESLQHQSSVGDLLNCSAGSDDVFPCGGVGAGAALPLPPPRPPQPPARPVELDHPPHHDDDDSDEPVDDAGTIVGVDEASRCVSVWVRAVSRPQWGAVCPACLRPLGPPPAPAPAPRDPPHLPAVALVHCHHLIHLHCLNAHLEKLRSNGEPLYIECLVCGKIYGKRDKGAVPRAEPDAAAGCVGAAGECGQPGQPRGSMAWALRRRPLPTHPHVPAILVTYNFQSGRQGAGDPVPGAPYYAVGFPRHSLLPDTPLGRQVLCLLCAAWSRGRLFRVRASLTTGREHVVAWCARAPPADRAAYAAAGSPAAAETILRDVVDGLRELLARKTVSADGVAAPAS